MMQLLDQYSKLQEEIYNYFGYDEQWRVFPIADARKYVWYLDDNDIIYADKFEDFLSDDHYSSEVYTYRHLDKHVFRGEEYTMILINTQTDGNIFLSIFDNSKELESDPLDIYEED